MALKKNQLLGAAVLVSLALLYVPLPFIDGRSIASVILLVAGIYLLLK